jgi:hypothetical protein
MNSVFPIVAAGIVASTLALSPVQAQTPTPAASAPAAMGSGFDAYQALAVTAGVVGGAVIAVVVTDGLIIPVYAWATGAGGGGMAAAGAGAAAMEGGGLAAGGIEFAGAGGAAMEGAGVVGMGAETIMVGMGNSIQALGHGGYGILRGGMRILGAVSGGFLANSWYTGE